MRIDRQKAAGWVGISLFALAAIYVWRGKSPSQLAIGAGFLIVCLGAIALAFLGWEALGRLWRRIMPPPPLWRKPRGVSALFESELFAPLQERLDLLEQDGRASLWRDRESGQLWSAFAWDFEFTENVVYSPITRREDWTGMAGEAKATPGAR